MNDTKVLVTILSPSRNAMFPLMAVQLLTGVPLLGEMPNDGIYPLVELTFRRKQAYYQPSLSWKTKESSGVDHHRSLQ